MTSKPPSARAGTACRVLGWVFGHRLAQAAVWFGLFLGVGWLAPGGVALFAMLALTGYSLAAPASLLWARRFWWSALASAGIWLLLFWALNAGCGAFHGPLGDDAMVFLLPFLTFPTALGIVTIARWIRRSAAPPPASSV